MHRDPRDVENEALRAQLSDVLARLDVALAQNAELVTQVAKLNERIAELMPVAKRKARKAKPTTPSEAPPPVLTPLCQEEMSRGAGACRGSEVLRGAVNRR